MVKSADDDVSVQDVPAARPQDCFAWVAEPVQLGSGIKFSAANATGSMRFVGITLFRNCCRAGGGKNLRRVVSLHEISRLIPQIR